MEPGHFLIGGGDATTCASLNELLRGAGHVAEMAASGPEVLDKVRATSYDLLLCALDLPPGDGVALLREVKTVRPSVPVALFGEAATVERVLGAFHSGAYDYLEQPIAPEKLLALAARALSIKELGERRRKLAEELESERLRVLELERKLEHGEPFERIIGRSALFGQVIDTIREVARTDSTVLLTGESGTGKGLVARTIHESSARRDRPFVEANCVVYSEGVLHSELFGHERGAFTGAARTKKGRFELAAGGTLFLDEIGEISTATQLLLLRVLQERTFERVGGEETLEADVRLVAATNRDLAEAIRQGTFRSDLYYRLNVIPVHLPPLREHADDVPVLAQHFLSHCAGRLGRQVAGFSPEAMEALVRYRWPGNIRELENTIERMVVLNRSGLLEVADLPAVLREGLERPGVVQSVPGTLQSIERQRVAEVLLQTGGNKKRAAQILGIHRSTLYAKMRRYDLVTTEGDAATEADRHEAEEAAVPALTTS